LLAPPWLLDLHLARDAKLPCHLSANLGNIQSCSPAKEMKTFVKLYVQGETSKISFYSTVFSTKKALAFSTSPSKQFLPC
jgi:hypothetical protein